MCSSRPEEWRPDVTVCLAAIAQWSAPSAVPGQPATITPVIVAISDRMYTFAEIREYEPLQTKVFDLAPAMRVLIAGDSAPLVEICRRTQSAMQAQSVTRVEVAADLLAQEYANLRNRQAERRVLAPFRLTIEDFLSSQQRLSPEFVDYITTQLSSGRYAGLDAEVIVTGVDETGAHIYVVRDPGMAQCYDALGFAAIGSGAEYASATFMEYQYAPSTSDWRYTILLAYQAKRSAEVAPGVGNMTDINIVSALFGGVLFDAQSPLVTYLHDSYYARRKANLEAAKEDLHGLATFMEAPGATAETQSATPENRAARDAESDEQGVSGSPEEGQPEG